MDASDRPWFVRYSVYAARALAILSLVGLAIGSYAIPAGWLLLWITFDLSSLTDYLMTLFADKKIAKTALLMIELADATIVGTSEFLYWLLGLVCKGSVYSVIAVILFYVGFYTYKIFIG